MEVEENGKKSKSKSSKSRSKTTRGRGRTKGRTKKAVKVIESDDDDVPQNTDENAMDTTNPSPESQETPAPNQNQQSQQSHPPAQQTVQSVVPNQSPIEQTQQFDLEADISQLEAPTFTTINRGPPEPMLRLRWDHRVNLIGEKVLNPMIHCCDKCLKPILIYGRMIPCKHVFCLLCAKKEEKACPRCNEKVARVEQTGLGTVFMCTHGGSRYGNNGCRRTYLSQRDLQAHINHRHVSAPPPQQVQVMPLDNSTSYIQHKGSDLMDPMMKMNMQNNRMKTMSGPPSHNLMGNDPRVNAGDHRQGRHYSQTTSTTSNAMRSNLITVPIQDTSSMEMQNQTQQQSQSHHYYHSDNHPNAGMTARWVLACRAETEMRHRKSGGKGKI
ncbi:unnamed protein product [Trichogramma brassicae]|uniref:E3 ubiquitin-protein ligase Hakai n=1 Tax=Trichogramma brassicae TaxID=86971 RepID=A0A6H5HZL5_9HYME|nr:unnamed protein product [Trichogramma brassicae]